MIGKGLLQKHFCKTFVEISANNKTINGNFRFSHYYSLETLCCHSNQTSNIIGMKKDNNTIYVEDNVINMYAIKVLASSPL